MSAWSDSFRWSDLIRWAASLVGSALVFILVSITCMVLALLAMFMPTMED